MQFQFDPPVSIQAIVERQQLAAASTANTKKSELLVIVVASPIHRMSASVLKQASAIRETLSTTAGGGSAPLGSALAAVGENAIRIVLSHSDDNVPFYMENSLVAGTPIVMMYALGRRILFSLDGRRSGEVANCVAAGSIVGHLTRGCLEALIAHVSNLLVSGKILSMTHGEDSDSSDYDEDSDDEAAAKKPFRIAVDPAMITPSLS